MAFSCYNGANRNNSNIVTQFDLFSAEPVSGDLSAARVVQTLKGFTWHGRATECGEFASSELRVPLPVLTNEYWTSRQRAAHSLHEVSYRACFKPQLPAFFINLLTNSEATVYDPFAGRGTTLIEAALLGRSPAGCDVNPLSELLIRPRLSPPAVREVIDRLGVIDLAWRGELPDELLTFYHPETLAQICGLRHYLLDKASTGTLDEVDAWIRMVTANRLTGHSSGFLSVYTLPPNQAVSVQSQQKINIDRGQTPPRRELRDIVAKKTAALLADVDDITRQRLAHVQQTTRFVTASCETRFWCDASVDLIVTSPPFLDVIDYAADNWLRCWFCGISAEHVPISVWRKLDDWMRFVAGAFRQFARLLRPGGFIAFEVGEVKGGTVRLEEAVVPCGISAGLVPLCFVVNRQTFTKTANIWGVTNNAKGTNSNRIVLFHKPG